MTATTDLTNPREHNMARHEIDLPYSGQFSLPRSVSSARDAAFVKPTSDDESLEMALCLDDSWHPVGARVEQDADGRVRAFVSSSGATPIDDVRRHLGRVLSLDTEGSGFAEVVARDSVVAKLERMFCGLRPILIASPYEAAARAIIGHRLGVPQAATVHARIAAEYGVAVEVGEGSDYAFPDPHRLSDLAPVRGLAEKKVEQLRALGRFAVEGGLSARAVRAMPRADAMVHLQRIPGVGPFSAELIMMRGVGDPDAFPRTEERLHRAMATLYDLGDDPAIDLLEHVADEWRPYRTWVGLMLRHAERHHLLGRLGTRTES